MSKVIYTEDNPFVRWANIKYRKILGLSDQAVKFYSWDDYAVFLWYEYCKQNDDEYYSLLEEDFKEYSDSQQEKVKEL